MTIEDFWNQAFLAALTRCPVVEAKSEADKALKACIEQWQSNNTEWSASPILWQKQDVAHVPKLREKI
jgi:hypothetical protein